MVYSNSGFSVSAPKVDSRRKSLAAPRNRTCVSGAPDPTLYQLSYISAPTVHTITDLTVTLELFWPTSERDSGRTLSVCRQ